MKKNNKNLLANGLLICGVFLILGGIGAFLYMQISQNKANQQMITYVEQLQQIMPEITEAFAEDRIDTEMPMMEVDGENFVGLLEIPDFGKAFPIGSEWADSAIKKYPCRYWGSLYDGSLIIGGSNSRGQMEFMEAVSIGDTIQVTDMMGQRYSYTVFWIEKANDVSTEYLETGDAKLTIFAGNPYGLDYTVVRCE